MSNPISSQPVADGRAAARTQIETREFLAFKLGAEEYGIDILKVQEIRGYEKPTRMANVPEFIKGVVNLRGIIVPIIDMRIKFNMASVEYNEFTVVIILTVGGRVLGIVVDGVSDVTTLTPDQIKTPPDLFLSNLDTSSVMGLGTLDERMLILMDIEKLMSDQQMALSDIAPIN